MAIETVPELVQLLRENHLLDSAQLTQLAGQASQFADAKALARELVKRTWLSAYQVNQLFLGRGKDLVLGPYVLLDRLGEGGMGHVYRARHQLMNRVVAIKVIRKERLSRPEVVRRFQREIQAVAQLSHPNIVVAHDAAQVGDVHFFAMEYVDGLDLGKLVKQRGPLPVLQACDYIRQTALGLQHAHERGLVHRDIKPHNLILSGKNSVVKILDLGLARVNIVSEHSEDSGVLTQEGSVMGTADYIAPEQALDTHRADIRADIYSLGCTFYHLLTGQAPFPGGSMAQKLLCHQQAEPPPVEKFRSDVPPGLAQVLRKMMAKNAGERYQTPAEVAGALEVFCRTTLPVAVMASASTSGSYAGLAQAPTASVAIPVARPIAAPSQDTFASGTATSETALPVAPAAAPAPAARKPWPRWAIPAGAGGALALVLIVWLLTRGSGSTPDDNPDLTKGKPSPSPGLVPWDKLPPRLTADSRLPWKAPDELVAVLGEDRARHWGAVRCLAVSRDGKLAASGGKDRTIRIWDTATMTGRAVLKGHTAGVASVAFSPDGRHLLSGGEDVTARLWDIEAGKEIRQFAGHAATITFVAFSSDGARAYTFSHHDNPLRVYQVQTGTYLRGFKQQSAGTYYADLPADFRTVLVGGGPESSLRLFDLDNQEERAKWRLTAKDLAAKPVITSVALAPNGTLALAGYTDKFARLWDVEKSSEVKRFEHAKGVNAVAFTPDNKSVITASADQTIRLWDAEAGKETAVFEGHVGSVNCLALLPGGRRLLSGGTDGTVRLWDIKSGKEAIPVNGHVAPVRAVAFAHDGRHIVSSGTDKSVRLWGLQNLNEVRRFDGHEAAVHVVDISPDGKRVLSAAEDRTIRYWDVDTGRALLNLNINQGAFLAFTPDGQHGCITHEGIWLQHIELEVGRSLYSPEQHVGAVRCGAISPDGRRVLTGASDYVVRLFDLEKRKELGRFVGHTDAVLAVSFTADRRYFISAGADKTVRHWDADNETAKKRLVLQEHPGRVTNMAFAAEGKTVAGATAEGHVFVWDAATGAKSFDWKLPGPVHRLAFSPDGRHLATANANGTVYIFRLGPS